MVTATFLVVDRDGLQARAAVQIAKLAAGFESSVTIHNGNVTVDAKSILGLLTLGASPGTPLAVCVAGTDEEEALAALEVLLARQEETAPAHPRPTAGARRSGPFQARTTVGDAHVPA